ncbi:MAG: PLP-dependent transferase, partial [Deltaproteobacteria bacterium]|nr:PLP-dependent transferase [Deltaproteobacteria bacterium]
ARKVTGAVMGALETWLTLRSLRTLGLRVERQSASAARLAAWLSTRVPKTWHPSLPEHPGHALLHSQMHGMGGGVLSIDMADEAQARALPARLRLFREATSLGGVESLIEWRRRNDPMARPTLLRISVGLEHPDDLIADFTRALEG